MIHYLALVILALPSIAQVPEWLTKPSIQNRIHQDRFIFMKAESFSENGKKGIRIKSAGIIEAPLSVTHKMIQEYDQYSKFVPYVEESILDKKTGLVFVHGALLGYHVKMTVRLTPKDSFLENRIFFETVSGYFTGMKGYILERESGKNKTEISMEAEYAGETLNLPDFLTNWGIEIAGQRAAGAMRDRIEKSWKSTL